MTKSCIIQKFYQFEMQIRVEINLQGGVCTERFVDCNDLAIINKIKL